MVSGSLTADCQRHACAAVMHRRHRDNAYGTALGLSRYGAGYFLMTYNIDDNMPRVYMWGAVAWGTETKPAMGYESEPQSTTFRSQRSRTVVIPMPDDDSLFWDRARPR